MNRPGLLRLAAGLLVLAVGVVDLVTGPEVSLSIFYLIPIGISAWFLGRNEAIGIAIASAIVWLVADRVGHHSYSSPAIPYWNSLVRLGFFGIVVFLIRSVRGLNEQLETAVEQKTIALQAEILERSRVEQALLEISRQEQERIAHDLHDELGQRLTYAALKTKMLAQDVPAAQAAAAEEITRLINDATQHVRRLARGLDPIDVEVKGLTAALDRLTKETEAHCRIRCGFTFNRRSMPLPPSACLNLYRIAQEALNNATRHAGARSLDVELTTDEAGVCLRISDDGSGFDPQTGSPQGMGLRIMRHRARTLGGTLLIISTPNRGTTVDCRIPFAAAGLVTPRALAEPKHGKETHSDRG